MKYAWVIDQFIFLPSTLLFLSAAHMLKGRRRQEEKMKWESKSKEGWCAASALPFKIKDK